MSIKERILADIKDAMRAGETTRRDTLRLVTAAIKQVEVDERIEVDEARMLVILDKMVKQRNESISQFQSAGRTDLVEKEQSELAIIRPYLPEPLTEKELVHHIEQAIMAVKAEKMSDMGQVMAYLKPLLQGRADMARVSTVIKEKLH